MTKQRFNLTMGNVLTAAGLIIRALQICFMSFGVRAAANPVLTLVVTCVTVGGFCVMAAELRGRGAVFSLLCAAFMLCGVMSAGSLKILGAVSMLLTFAAFVLLLCTMPRGGVQFILVVLIVILSAVILFQTVGVFTIPTAVISVILAGIYVSMGAGLIL